jgi:hypothetical protein
VTGWVAWAALILAALELVFIAALIVLCMVTWRKLAPQVTPLLGMFAAPAPMSPTPTSTDAVGTRNPNPDPPRP